MIEEKREEFTAEEMRYLKPVWRTQIIFR